MDNKSKWNMIREIVVGRTKSIDNFYDDLCCVPPQYSFSFRFVDKFEVLECISAVKSNTISSDD